MIPLTFTVNYRCGVLGHGTGPRGELWHPQISGDFFAHEQFLSFPNNRNGNNKHATLCDARARHTLKNMPSIWP